MKEKGGLNLYGFCGNNGVNRWDYLGMSPMADRVASELEYYREKLARLMDEERDHGYSPGTGPNQSEQRATAQMIEDLEWQLGQYSQGADGNNSSRLATGGPNLILTWSTRDGWYGPFQFQPVHQIAIWRALAHISESDRKILMDMQVVADEDQRPAFQYRHAMRNGPTGQTVEEAKKLANDYVRDRITEARKLEKEGDHVGALELLGMALHTLQDSTSPSHIGFQPWGGAGSQTGLGHVLDERTYPGDKSLLFQITQTGYKYFTGELEMPEDFFPHS